MLEKVARKEGAQWTNENFLVSPSTILMMTNHRNSNTIDQMQLEIGASGAAQSENTLDQIIEQVITDVIGLSMSQEPALSINSIGSAAIVPSPGPASSDPSLGPPSPLPN